MNSAGTLEGILELGYAFRGAKALMSAVELGVFTALTEGPLDCEKLCERLGLRVVAQTVRHEKSCQRFREPRDMLGDIHKCDCEIPCCMQDG